MIINEIIDQLTKSTTKTDFEKTTLLKSYPKPVQRFFAYHLPKGIPQNDFNVVPLRGLISLASWSNFSSVLYINPLKGFCWKAVVWMGIIPVNGYDFFFDGQGAMNWTVMKYIPVLKAEGPDTSRSAEGRALMESCFAPHTLIHPDVNWEVVSENEITATWKIHRETTPVHFVIGNNGSLKQAFIQRWGNPEESNVFDYHSFGVNIEQESFHGGVVIPTKGNAGWWFGSEKYKRGEFFRFKLG